jgi:hypothetical protein
LHAVRYHDQLKAYIKTQGYDLGVLVAFSGGLIDEGDPRPVTEAKLNGFPDSQTVDHLAGDDYHVLVVAEKYQTGFDQPLLCAMYVDKVLTGLNAVQTLSRLNRIHPAKRQDDVFVLDFRNDADDIHDAFEPWYGKTIAPPTDPNLLYDTHRQLGEFGVLRPDEVLAFVAALFSSSGSAKHSDADVELQPAVERFRGVDEDEQETFRDALNRFTRTYAFLSQIVTFSDVKLERDYLFCKGLASYLRPEDAGSFDLGKQVELTHLRPDDGEVFKPLETASLKTLAAFLNSREGGTLLIGVADDGTPWGLATDYASLHKADKDDRDRYQQHLVNITSQSFGEAAAAEISAQFHTVDGKDICRVHVRPCGFPVDAQVIVAQNDQMVKEVAFFIRVGNGTRKLNSVEREKNVATHWGTPQQ